MWLNHGQKGTSVGFVLFIGILLMILCSANRVSMDKSIPSWGQWELSHWNSALSPKGTKRSLLSACWVHTHYLGIRRAVSCSLWKQRQRLAQQCLSWGQVSPYIPSASWAWSGLAVALLREGTWVKAAAEPGDISTWLWDTHPHLVAAKCTCAPPPRGSISASPYIFQKIDETLAKAVFIPSLLLQILYRARD